MPYKDFGGVGAQGGGWRDCPICGKPFFVCDIERWAYKRSVYMGDGGKRVHFCSWHCVREFDKEYEAKKKENRKGWKVKKA